MLRAGQSVTVAAQEVMVTSSVTYCMLVKCASTSDDMPCPTYVVSGSGSHGGTSEEGNGDNGETHVE